MIPPRGISRRLSEFDRTLRLRWNMVDERWEVWCFPDNTRPYRVITVREDNGAYRPPDNRIFIQLAFSDLTRYASKREQLAVIDNAFETVKRSAQKRLEDATAYDLADKLAWAIKRDNM